MFAAGYSEILVFNRLIDTHKVIWRIEIPAEHPFKFAQFGPGLEFSDTTQDGLRQLEWKTTEQLGIFDFEVSVPPSVVQGTQVAYSTATSWEDVVRSYSVLVQEKIDDQNLAEQAEQILAGETDREKQIEKLVSFVKLQIRYTGLMFGNGTIVPTAPEETLRG